jgi:hypothetical protein
MNLNTNSLVAFLAHRNVHKLAGTALASYGLVVSNWRDLLAGGAYAAVMHIVGGIKQLPDTPPV